MGLESRSHDYHRAVTWVEHTDDALCAGQGFGAAATGSFMCRDTDYTSMAVDNWGWTGSTLACYGSPTRAPAVRSTIINRAQGPIAQF
jgi:hypothetical protein